MILILIACCITGYVIAQPIIRTVRRCVYYHTLHAGHPRRI